MTWTVIFCDEFDVEFQAMPTGLQDELLAHALLLRKVGPELGRPTVDTLKGSKYSNMKELRLHWNSEIWRVAFAFDPKRRAVFLVGGDKRGADMKRFYKRLIKKAEERYEKHMGTLDASDLDAGGKYGQDA